MRMWSGRALQVAGPACENARSVVPRSHVLIFGPSFSGPALSVHPFSRRPACCAAYTVVQSSRNLITGAATGHPRAGRCRHRSSAIILGDLGRGHLLSPAGRPVSLQNVWCRGMRKCGNVSVDVKNAIRSVALITEISHNGWLGIRVVSVLDSGAEGPRLKSQSRRCRVTVLGKLFTPIVPLFTKQRNW